MVWLLCLDAKDKRAMRDDVTPAFKEVATEPRVLERLREHDDTAPDERLSDEVLDHLRRRDDDGAALHVAIRRAARASMPEWKFRAFALWFKGENRARIARALNVSRSTVRSALDGEGRGRGIGDGAIKEFMAAISADDDFKKVVMSVATKSIAKTEQRAGARVLGWFKGIEQKPDMVIPLAMLMVLDELADARREVAVADIIPHFPRSLITPCMRLLAAHGFAASNGHRIKVHKTPVEKVSA